jgi:hypothetical protein
MTTQHLIAQTLRPLNEACAALEAAHGRAQSARGPLALLLARLRGRDPSWLLDHAYAQLLLARGALVALARAEEARTPFAVGEEVMGPHGAGVVAEVDAGPVRVRLAGWHHVVPYHPSELRRVERTGFVEELRRELPPEVAGGGA